jgi:hypothetical protein
MTKRVIAFIDGFNLYHSIDNQKRLHRYKWLDLQELINQFLTSKERLKELRYFTAYSTWDVDKRLRHEKYVHVLKGKGVRITLGQFLKKQKRVGFHVAIPVDRILKPLFVEKYSTHMKRS